jgi:alcohol dehydrogenase class IV
MPPSAAPPDPPADSPAGPFPDGAPAAWRGDWDWPTAVRFGVGRIAELPDLVRGLGLQAPLVVSDAGLAATPMVGAVVERLGRAGFGTDLVADLAGEPDVPAVARAALAFRRGGHDGVIAIGGGSALDLGKAAALAGADPRPILDYAGGRRTPDAVAPIVAVPTTAGTGAEVSPSAVVVDPETGTKRSLMAQALTPTLALIDPALAVGLPPRPTAWAGLDALIHGLEALVARPAPGSEGAAEAERYEALAVEAVALALGHVEAAVADGGDLDARAGMAAAALMGGIAFTKGLGAVHAIAHAVGARYHTPHGLTNAVVLRTVLPDSRPAIDPGLDRLAGRLGLADADAVAGRLGALLDALDVPAGLGALGVPADAVPELAALAALDVNAATHPIPLDAAGFARLIERAL